MKENFEVLKELWKIPRWHALLKMGLYFLFFLVFGLIFFSKTTPKKNINNTTNTNTINISNYSFKFTINNEIIEGRKEQNIEFKYNDNDYSIIDDIIFCELEDCSLSFKYLFELFLPNRINNYIRNGKLLSKTEYVDGIMEYKYEIDNEDIKKYFNSESNFEISVMNNKYTLNLENYNIFDKIVLEYK